MASARDQLNDDVSTWGGRSGRGVACVANGGGPEQTPGVDSEPLSASCGKSHPSHWEKASEVIRTKSLSRSTRFAWRLSYLSLRCIRPLTGDAALLGFLLRLDGVIGRPSFEEAVRVLGDGVVGQTLSLPPDLVSAPVKPDDVLTDVGCGSEGGLRSWCANESMSSGSTQVLQLSRDSPMLGRHRRSYLPE